MSSSEIDSGTDDYAPEALFPGDNEIFLESAAWGSPEYEFWFYFFKIVSNNAEDYHTDFVKKVKDSKDGKIDWKFWTKSSFAEPSVDAYEKSVQLLIDRVTSSEFVFGKDYVKKLIGFVDKIIHHREAQLKKFDLTYRSHTNILDMWKQVRDILSKVKTGPSTMDWIFMVIVVALAVYIYYLYRSITNLD